MECGPSGPSIALVPRPVEEVYKPVKDSATTLLHPMVVVIAKELVLSPRLARISLAKVSNSEQYHCLSNACNIYTVARFIPGPTGLNGQTAQSHAMAPDPEAELVSTLPKSMGNISVKARVTREFLVTKANTVSTYCKLSVLIW
ncbi:hypothetical protein EB796_020121 [Bugula neritina]|uniref:Uncharacterized protein n=1 Tax=Bugula neritina TaxID=10212 RepID=A0A7J7J5S3_BUGNE|nr:hypothetical protein EB796_020121 [Bugula neritina]